jgi:hypothetical protein
LPYPIILSIINQKRIIMLNKNQSKKKNLWKYALVVPALVPFYAVSSKCRGAGKAKETT